jgi:hypothetical protein
MTALNARWRMFRSQDSAEAIYGTIAAMAVIAGSAHEPAHGRMLALTVATLAVFWRPMSMPMPSRTTCEGRDGWTGPPSARR